MSGRGGVQVVKTHGEPVYVNSLAAGSEWEMERASGQRKGRSCRAVHALLCLIALLLALLLAVALLAYLPKELYWHNGQLKFDWKIRNVDDTPRFEMLKGEIPTQPPGWLTMKPPKRAEISVSHVFRKTRVHYHPSTDANETAVAWSCNAAESLLRGGVSCTPDATGLRAPVHGVYRVDAQVAMACWGGGKPGVLPSARLVSASNARGKEELALAHLLGCAESGLGKYATMQLTRVYELLAGDEVSVKVMPASRLYRVDKLTFLQLQLLGAHED